MLYQVLSEYHRQKVIACSREAPPVYGPAAAAGVVVVVVVVAVTNVRSAYIVYE